MIVRIDPRTGPHKKVSQHVITHLVQPLSQLLDSRFSVKTAEMKFGDIAWAGEGDEAHPIAEVGVEMKTISDLLGSIESGRLIEHQLPGLHRRYDVAWLLIVGEWHPGLVQRANHIITNKRHGMLRILSGMAGKRGWLRKQWRDTGWQYTNLLQIICGLCYRFNIRPWRVTSHEEALWWLASQIQWWEKPWAEHHSGEAWTGVNCFGAQSHLRTPSDCEKVAAVLNGIGQRRARWVANHFGNNIHAMVTAAPEDWVGIREPGLTKTGKKHPGFTMTSALAIQKQLRKIK